MTRAVSGLSLLSTAFASSSRPLPSVNSGGGNLLFRRACCAPPLEARRRFLDKLDTAGKRRRIEHLGLGDRRHRSLRVLLLGGLILPSRDEIARQFLDLRLGAFRLLLTQ